MKNVTVKDMNEIEKIEVSEDDDYYLNIIKNY